MEAVDEGLDLGFVFGGDNVEAISDGKDVKTGRDMVTYEGGIGVVYSEYEKETHFHESEYDVQCIFNWKTN